MSKAKRVKADWEVLISIKVRDLIAHDDEDALTVALEAMRKRVAEDIASIAYIAGADIVKLRPLMPKRKKKVVSIELPWPERILHPNSRAHWSRVGPRKRVARVRAKRAMEAALEATRMPRKPDGEKYLVSLMFHPPEIKRKRDEDGMLASMKAALDGIADAMGVDDSNFKVTTQVCDPRGSGLVVVMVE